MKLSEEFRRILAAAEVAEQEYREACEAYQTSWEGREGRLAEIPHDICSALDDTAADTEEALRLYLDLLDDMPCYAVLMYLRWLVWDSAMDSADGRIRPDTNLRRLRLQMWARFREYLSRPKDCRAEPIAYSLWCDWFEDDDSVDEAWEAMLDGASNKTLLRRLLKVSGPVPYSLKAPLYQRLLPDKSMHEAIFQSLLFSCFDYFGQVDLTAASRVFENLELPPDTQNLDRLRQMLWRN